MTDSRKEEMDFEISFYEGLVTERPNYIEALIPLAEAYTRKGLYEKGLLIDKRLARLCSDDPTVFYNLACSHALIGDKKKALSALKEAFRLGYDDLAHLRNDKDLKSLHGNPGFESLTASLKKSKKENYG